MSLAFYGPDGREYVWRYPHGLCPHGVFVNDPTFTTTCPTCEEEGYPSFPPYIQVVWTQDEWEGQGQGPTRKTSDEGEADAESEDFHPDDVRGWFEDDPALFWIVLGSLLTILVLGGGYIAWAVLTAPK